MEDVVGALILGGLRGVWLWLQLQSGAVGPT